MRRFCSPRLLVAAALVCAFIGSTIASERTASAMAKAANAFLAALTPEQRQQAVFAFDSAEREKWHFIPTEMFARNGLLIKSMTEPQRKLAHELLRTGFSQRGYMTVSQIMELETILAAVESAAPRGRGTPLVRDPEKYYFSVFGTPAAKGTWGWRVEGHHISAHFTVVNGSLVAGSPTFYGANPAEVKSGPRAGFRALGPEEDAARALFMALDEPRRAKALINAAAPNDIVTMNNLPINPLTPAGISGAELTAAQRELLSKLLDVYVGYMTPDMATERMEKLRKAGLEKITFAWAGEAERGKRHYYRLQGPTFLIEYDNTQNDANHIHSIWRDFAGDFGRDLLREHVSTVAHR
jgi:hypothetical protein